MRRLLIVAGAITLAVGLTPTDTSAQQVAEAMRGALNQSVQADTFGCGDGTAATCGLHQRMYGDLDPREINGPNAIVDGFPSWRNKASRYLGDTQQTNNYSNASLKPCEAWYSVWDGAINAADPTYISYYATQSLIVNVAEGGNQNNVDCSGTNQGIACFGAVDATLSIDTPDKAGQIDRDGGLSPVPVPQVAATADASILQVSVAGTAAGNNLNTPSLTGVSCPATAPFDDLTETSGPGAIAGIGLYVYEGSPRSLQSLENASAGLNALLANPSGGMACTSNADCPGVGFVPCSSIVGATCAGDLMVPEGTSGQVSRATVEAALGVGVTGGVTFVSKVHYRGSGPGTHANPENSQVNPSLVSLFSANSNEAGYDGLAARVSITRINVSGNRVVLDWSTVGGSFVEFTVQKADDGVTFTDLGTVVSAGETEFSFTDTIRGRRPAQTTYRILATDTDGEVTQVFETVDLGSKPSRGGARR